ESHFKNQFSYAKEFIRWGFRNPGNETVSRIDETLHRAAHRHRINLVTDASLRDNEQDWQEWDAVYGKYLDGGFFTESPGKGAPGYHWMLTFDPGASEDDLRRRLKLAADHFEKKGWLDRVMVNCFDEPKPSMYPLV